MTYYLHVTYMNNKIDLLSYESILDLRVAVAAFVTRCGDDVKVFAVYTK